MTGVSSTNTGQPAAALQSVFGATRAPDEAWLARAEPEPAINPELPIVDPHMHFPD